MKPRVSRTQELLRLLIQKFTLEQLINTVV